MDTKVTIALIAAAGSLLVALVSLLTAFVTNRIVSRTAESLERLKYSLDRSNRTLELVDSELKSSLEALRLAMQAIQRLKDEIQLTINAYGTSLDSMEASERIEAARQQLFQVYEEMHPRLNEHEAMALHRAKNVALSVSQRLTDELRRKKFASEIDSIISENALLIRTELTEAQNLLRDSRTERLIHLSTMRQ